MKHNMRKKMFLIKEKIARGSPRNLASTRAELGYLIGFFSSIALLFIFD